MFISIVHLAFSKPSFNISNHIGFIIPHLCFAYKGTNVAFANNSSFPILFRYSKFHHLDMILVHFVVGFKLRRVDFYILSLYFICVTRVLNYGNVKVALSRYFVDNSLLQQQFIH